MHSPEEIYKHHNPRNLSKRLAPQATLAEEDERCPPITDSHANTVPLYTNTINVYPANSYIIDQIDWHSLSSDHPLSDDKPRHRHSRDEERYIKHYSAARGSALHALLETWPDEEADPEEALQQALNQLDNLPSDSHEEALQTIADWDGSSATRTVLCDSAKEQLREEARQEAYSMELRLMEWRSKTNIYILQHEYIYCFDSNDTRPGRGFGGQADLIIVVPSDSPLDAPAGIYAVEVKTTQEINNAHRLQAEAHRRGVNSKCRAEIGGMILHVTPDSVALETHHSEDWQQEVLYEALNSKIQYLYESEMLKARIECQQR